MATVPEEMREVMDRVAAWPPESRTELARWILESLTPPAAPHRPRPTMTAEELRRWLRVPDPSPDDETVRRWRDEHLAEKYGRP